MRPVDRREPPGSGGPQTPDEARDALLAQLGPYCCYCERPIEHIPELEHIRPKSLYPDLALAWGNLLLSCKNCNATKGHRDIALGEYYWPDRDNTLRAFAYFEEGWIAPHEDLRPDQVARACRTISLTGLNRVSTPKDRRTRQRAWAWEVASQSLERLCACGSAHVRAQIIETALAVGFFSVWMTVFVDHPDMRTAFVGAFPAAPDCFDADANPIPRPGGDL
ncbi:MAG: HNH endonuclease [Armatimonadetes bacterium]|nr:HNH endonuclease [Armatimonadota bacterium]